jgi:hypothetical protein
MVADIALIGTDLPLVVLMGCAALHSSLPKSHRQAENGEKAYIAIMIHWATLRYCATKQRRV